MTTEKKAILTVMPDYGNGPFLWIDRSGDESRGVGGNCCDATGPCDFHPISVELHRAFAGWVTEFERIPVSDDGTAVGVSFDWESFHARGLELAARLKAEVGDDYRVIYEKPYEDVAGRSVDERREVHADGRVTLLPARAEHP